MERSERRSESRRPSASTCSSPSSRTDERLVPRTGSGSSTYSFTGRVRGNGIILKPASSERVVRF